MAEATRTMTLSDFLLERISEDEAAATERVHTPLDPAPFDEIHTSAGRMYADPHHTIDITDAYSKWVESLPLSDRARRVLAECEAKRRIVELHSGAHICWTSDYDWDDPDEHAAGEGTGGPCLTLRYLALSYTDHPDYDESWRS